MNKFSCLKMLENNGDSVISLREDADIVATIDFSTPYIKNKRYGKYKMEKNSILLFSWTDDAFRTIDVKNIKNIKPLSDILRNVRDERVAV